jgi:hypothetical protein
MVELGSGSQREVEDIALKRYLPPDEDIKKVQRRLQSEEKKALKSAQKLTSHQGNEKNEESEYSQNSQRRTGTWTERWRSVTAPTKQQNQPQACSTKSSTCKPVLMIVERSEKPFRSNAQKIGFGATL